MTLTERLLTAPHILALYLKEFLFPVDIKAAYLIKPVLASGCGRSAIN